MKLAKETAYARWRCTFWRCPSIGSGTSPFAVVRLLRRFGIWEIQGGAVDRSCRLIDDALQGGQNAATGAQRTHRPVDLDGWCAMIRAVMEAFEKDELSQFPSDFSKAYKQCPVDPEDEISRSSAAQLHIYVAWGQKPEPTKRKKSFEDWHLWSGS